MSSNLISSKVNTSKCKGVAVRIRALGPAWLVALVGLVSLVGLALISWQTAAQAQNQGQNFDRQALIERFRQARANGTLGRGGMRAAAGERIGGGQGGFSPQANGGSPGMRAEVFSDARGKSPSILRCGKGRPKDGHCLRKRSARKAGPVYSQRKSSAKMPILIFLHVAAGRMEISNSKVERAHCTLKTG